jgi:hypothetical protein
MKALTPAVDDRKDGWQATWQLITSVAVLATATPASAQSDAVPWRYTLIHGATLTDDCPICGRPALVLPMHGTFDLRLIGQNPLFTTYGMETIAFTAGYEGGPRYTLTGTGEYEVGGEVAITQRLSLTLRLDDGQSVKEILMTGPNSPVERLWPMMLTSAKQTNGTMVQQIDLVLSAAPFRDLWMSTAHGMTSGTTPPPFEYYRASEVLSISGHRVKRNADLTRNLGIMPIVPDIGLDALDVRPGGETAFSSTEAVFSESLGETLGPGDILSDRGRLLMRHTALLAPFSPMPPVADLGLDVLQDLGRAGYAFSVATGFFSEKLGRQIGRGDLLLSDGTVLKSIKDLLARFQPVDDGGPPVGDPGLDAVYLWPSGEIWFSTESGFQDKSLGPIRSGDILSDSGYIVFGNLDLVSAFSPLEDLADFGLDALVVVTDTLPAMPPPAAPTLTLWPPSDRLLLEWTGDGRFYQVLGAPSAGGPYAPMAPFQTNPFFERNDWLSTHPSWFFKVRQW